MATKSLDIIRKILDNEAMLTFYGKVTLCIENGKVVLVKKEETFKI